MEQLPSPAEVWHPVYATRVLCEVANERGVSTAEVLEGTAIEPRDLDDADTAVSALDETTAVRNVLARLPDGAGVGVDVGSRFSFTHFGLWGFAAMSCANLCELYTITARYFALTMLHIEIKVFKTADECVVEMHADHLPADVRTFFVERDVAGIMATTTVFTLPLTSRYADRMSSELAVEEELLGSVLEFQQVKDITFGRALTRVRMPRAMCEEPLPQADRHTLEMCLAQCDALMQRHEPRRGVAALVRAKLFGESGFVPTLPDVAAGLNVHPRTLARQLREEGTSFRALLNEARSAVAADLLRNVGLTVEEVSKRLGYTEVSTFSSAFKRWYGVPPRAYSRRA